MADTAAYAILIIGDQVSRQTKYFAVCWGHVLHAEDELTVRHPCSSEDACMRRRWVERRTTGEIRRAESGPSEDCSVTDLIRDARGKCSLHMYSRPSHVCSSLLRDGSLHVVLSTCGANWKPRWGPVPTERPSMLPLRTRSRTGAQEPFRARARSELYDCVSALSRAVAHEKAVGT